MLIVIEGMDGTGKTTLAKKLQEKFPQFEYQKPVPSEGPEGQTADYMINWMADRFKEIRSGANYIMDRINLVSEEIYGPICRGGSRLGADSITNVRMIDLMSKFFSLHPIIIYCRPDNDTIIDNLKNDGVFQMSGVLENSEKLIDAYDRFFGAWEKAGVPVIVYDYTEDSNAVGLINQITAKIVEGD
jgi:GTPase SAR1 family protein